MNKSSPHIHAIKFSDRTARITVTETPTAVTFELWFSHTGPWRSAADFEAFKRWFWNISIPYDPDPRPSVLINKLTGETLSVQML